MTKEKQTTTWAVRLTRAVKTRTERLNEIFDSLSTRTKKITMITVGLIMASVCSFILVQSIFLKPTPAIETDPIVIPKNSPMNKNQSLTPVGKMKGEIEGAYKSFHIAVDNQGQLFINSDPEFSKDSLNKEKGWTPITRDQLKQYEERLHFIPTPAKTMKR